MGVRAPSHGCNDGKFMRPLLLAALPVFAAALVTPADAITLPPGFTATIFADNLGHVRQLAVAPDGTVYANSWPGDSSGPAEAQAPGYLIALRDTRGTGHADQVLHFGPKPSDGSVGGTGIALSGNALYAEADTDGEHGGAILRFDLQPGQPIPAGPPRTVLSGLPMTGDHPMHPFIIDAHGGLFVDLGSATNACQRRNRAPGSLGLSPCQELATRAGIWRYSATALNQVFSPDERYATGIRNGEGFAADPTGRIFVTQHGRDQLHENWPHLYTSEQGQTLPAEELIALRKGTDGGWPFCYFDGARGKLLLAPEYGGDGGKTEGICAGKQPPVATFPAHWAPNDAKYYAGAAFPPAWRNGIYIAFHGSWNRAPGPQGGYNVVFQPMADGAASGPWKIFADSFAGEQKDPIKASFRPTGLAVAPDGALFISDDQHGRIWRVTASK
jgi:glucose/arabinose dehydrogenase